MKRKPNWWNKLKARYKSGIIFFLLGAIIFSIAANCNTEEPTFCWSFDVFLVSGSNFTDIFNNLGIDFLGNSLLFFGFVVLAQFYLVGILFGYIVEKIAARLSKQSKKIIKYGILASVVIFLARVVINLLIEYYSKASLILYEYAISLAVIYTILIFAILAFFNIHLLNLVNDKKFPRDIKDTYCHYVYLSGSFSYIAIVLAQLVFAALFYSEINIFELIFLFFPGIWWLLYILSFPFYYLKRKVLK